MTVAILDTLFDHPLFKKVETKNIKTGERIPYDVVNEALILAVQYYADIKVMKYLIEFRNADPAFKSCKLLE